jgi:hypothetical protein
MIEVYSWAQSSATKFTSCLRSRLVLQTSSIDIGSSRQTPFARTPQANDAGQEPHFRKPCGRLTLVTSKRI